MRHRPMQHTRIKFCGITRVTDAVAACDAGADAIGLVFAAKSSRAITAAAAHEIVAATPLAVTPVGLFVDAAVDTVLESARSAGLTHVQLHGHEDPAYVSAITGLRVIKAIHVSPTIIDELSRWRDARLAGSIPNLIAILLETHSSAAGGTGVENNWDAIAQFQDAGYLAGLPPIVLAGGLHALNVGEVVRRLRPYAVDVSSGIEQSKGVKSIEKMRAFFEAVHGADRD